MIYIVIVNWNGARDTIECLHSLCRLANTPINIIVCDNNSKAMDREELSSWIYQEFSVLEEAQKDLPGSVRGTQTAFTANSIEIRLDMLWLEDNNGFAKANNIGMNVALSRGDPGYIWLLNNDTVVDAYSCKSLISKMDDFPDIGICGSTLLNYNEPDSVQGVGFLYDIFKTKGYQIGQSLTLDKLPRVEDVEGEMTYVIGASMFVRPAFIKEIGLLSERYFLYFEEIDWAVRKGHWRLGWCPESIVFHKEGASIGSSATGRPSNRSIAFMTRSMILFYLSHYPWLLPVVLARIAFNAVRFLIARDTSACVAIMKGVSGIMRRPDALL